MSVDLEITGTKMTPSSMRASEEQIAAPGRSNVSYSISNNSNAAHFKNEDYIYDEKIMRNPGNQKNAQKDVAGVAA
jgi:hypothetical protein